MLLHAHLWVAVDAVSILHLITLLHVVEMVVITRMISVLIFMAPICARYGGLEPIQRNG